MNYFSTYNKEIGFKISVDGFHNTPYPIPYGCIVSLNPPGTLYTQETPGPARDVSRIKYFLNGQFFRLLILFLGECSHNS